MPDGPACVYCHERPALAPWRPFCSERCKMADLGRWLAGDYRLVGDEHEGDARHDPPDDPDDPDDPKTD